jgi:hypothetical protein
MSDSIKPTEVALWTAVQLLAALLGVSGFAVWAHQPLPRTSLALQEWITVQILATAMLFPMLASNWTTLLINVSIALPFAQLAGLLANQSENMILTSWLYGSVWLIGFYCWNWQLDPKRRLWLQSVAILCSAGAVVLAYLVAETSLANGGNDQRRRLLSAVVLDINHISWGCWSIISIPLISSIAWIAIKHQKFARK